MTNDVCAKCGRPAEVTLERGIHNEIMTPVCLACCRAAWDWQAFTRRKDKRNEHINK